MAVTMHRSVQEKQIANDYGTKSSLAHLDLKNLFHLLKKLSSKLR